uniref:Uncharacterized protein n=2 Tax=Wuchereria bancrofti TaxID=6293 RepID=A0AAF5RTI8_WUCBA
MLTIAFQSMNYLLIALTCITLTHSLGSTGIRTFQTEYDLTQAERRNQNMMDHLLRDSNGFGRADYTFGRTARNDAFQTSPLIRFGKRYVMDDERSELIAHLLHQYLQQQQYFDRSNRSPR